MKIEALKIGADVTINGQIISVTAEPTQKDEHKFTVRLVITDDTGSIQVVAWMMNDDPEFAELKASQGKFISLTGEVKGNTWGMDRDMQVIMKSEKRAGQTVWHYDFATPPSRERKIPETYRTKDGGASVLEPGKVQGTIMDLDTKAGWPKSEGPYGVEISQKSEGELPSVPTNEYCVIIDTETSGLAAGSPEYEIIEFGAIAIKGNEVIDEISLLIKPQNPVVYEQAQRIAESKECLRKRESETTHDYYVRRGIYKAMEVNRITPEELQSGLEHAEAKGAISSFLTKHYEVGATFAAYNADFDFAWLKAKFGLKIPEYIDIMQIAQLKDPRPEKGRYSAEAMLKYYKGDNYVEQHRALSDARDEAELLSLLNAEPYRPGRVNTPITIRGNKGRESFIKRWNLVHRTQTNPDRTVTWLDNDLAFIEACEIGTGGPESKTWYWFCQTGEIAFPYYVTYIEMQPEGNFELAKLVKIATSETIREYQRKLYEAAKAENLPVVWSGMVSYVSKVDKHYLEIALAETRKNRFPGAGFMTDDEIRAYLTEAISPEAAADIEAMSIAFHDRITAEPISIIPETLQIPVIPGAKENLLSMAEARLNDLYGPLPDDLVKERFENEVQGLIIEQDFSSIFWLAHLAIEKSREMGYSVGSRGSVGSSLLAYLVGITEINPLPPHHRCPECKAVVYHENPDLTGYDLPRRTCECGAEMDRDGFNIPVESFIGVGRAKPPDIDLNFSSEIQPRIIDFVVQTLNGRAIRAGTVNSIGDRSAKKIARKRTRNGQDTGCIVKGELYDRRKAEEIALKAFLGGIKTGTSQHPGGVIILPDDFDFDAWIPVQYAANNPDSAIVTCYTYNTMETAFMKLDLLGHEAPTIARNLQRTLDYEGLQITPELIKEILVKGVTAGISEYHTEFAKKAVNEIAPENFSELIKTTGLLHGENVWLKNGNQLKAAGHPLNELICCRDDLFQKLQRGGLAREKCQEITDAVRKGKGLNAKQRAFMREVGCPGWYIKSAEKIKYLFPKAHAAAYSLHAAKQAAAKVRNPAVFFSVVLSAYAKAFNAELLLLSRLPIEAIKQAVTEAQKILADYDPGLAFGEERKKQIRQIVNYRSWNCY